MLLWERIGYIDIFEARLCEEVRTFSLTDASAFEKQHIRD